MNRNSNSNDFNINEDFPASNNNNNKADDNSGSSKSNLKSPPSNSNTKSNFKNKNAKDSRPNRRPSRVRSTSRQNSVSRNRTGSSFSTTNISTSLVTQKFTNSSVITESFRQIKDRTIVIDLCLSPLKNRLEFQAQVWARKIISKQELYLKAILGRTRQSDWQRLLEETYIYSYFSCVLYALSDKRVAEISEDRHVLIGHGILYRYLLKPSFTFQHSDFTVRYNMNISEARLNSILKMAMSFPFIGNFITTSPRFYLENEEYDRILSGLASNMDQEGPIITSFTDDRRHDMYLTKDNFPIGNSFYSDNSNPSSSDWQFAFCEGKSILDSSTLFWESLLYFFYE
jgi:hypothetical protein